MKTEQNPALQPTRLKMPHYDPFTCFKDEEIKVEMKINWIGQSTIIDSVNLSLENYQRKTYALGRNVTKCEDGHGFFYRINLIIDAGSTTGSNIQVDQSVLTKVDLRSGKNIRFKFNLIKRSESDYYHNHPCVFSPSPLPRTRGGSIIVSI